MKNLLAFILVLMLAMHLASAITTDMKSEYSQSETAIVKIQGSLTSTIDNNQIEFKKGTLRIPFQFDVVNLEGTYYIWFVTPNNPGNYTLLVHDISTQEQQQLFTYYQNFSIGENKSDYTITPGALVSAGNYTLDIFLNADNSMSITSDFPETENINLIPGDNQISFTSYNNSGVYLMDIGSYSIPVYITSNNSLVYNNSIDYNSTNQSSQYNQTNTYNSTYENTSQTYGRAISIDIPALSKIAYYGSSPSYSFTIQNNWPVEVNEINFTYPSDIITLTALPTSIAGNGSYQFNLSFVNPLNNTVRTTLRITSSGGNLTIPISIDITKNASNLINAYTLPAKDNSSSSSFWCSELSGQLCPSGSLCSGTNVSAHDGICCIGTCSSTQGSSSSWIGWFIAGLVILVIAYFWHKYKSVKPSGNILGKQI